MLMQQTIEALYKLKLSGMAKGIQEQEANHAFREMAFEERLGLIVDRETVDRENRQLASRLKQAKLRHSATIEDIDFRSVRGLDKSLLLNLASCEWIKQHHNLLLTGPTGVGKTFIACGLAHKACREGFTVLYQRMGRMFHEFNVVRGEGRYLRWLKNLAKIEVIIIDDWCLESFSREMCQDIFELLEERYQRKSTIIVSQVPVDSWHAIIGDQTLADAILDRIVHNAHVITMKGESMRKAIGKEKKSVKV
ncbi:MAG: ATP-binding protein [Candidatus Riflebacteria bacterium]|nr:ATP-binding protein [Candidatus Riflebacteria bacterium]